MYRVAIRVFLRAEVIRRPPSSRISSPPHSSLISARLKHRISACVRTRRVRIRPLSSIRAYVVRYSQYCRMVPYLSYSATACNTGNTGSTGDIEYIALYFTSPPSPPSPPPHATSYSYPFDRRCSVGVWWCVD
jgi:hypothetical protein